MILSSERVRAKTLDTELIASHDAQQQRIIRLQQQVADLQCAKVLEMTDEQVVALLGGPEEADREAEHARYIAKVAIREAETNNKIAALETALTRIGYGDNGPDTPQQIALAALGVDPAKAARDREIERAQMKSYAGE